MLRLAKLPRRNRIRVGPQSAAMPAGVGFGGCEFARLVPLAIAPGQTVVDHFRVDEVAGAKHPPDFAAVTVGVGDLDADGVAEDFGGDRVSRWVPNAWAFSGASMPARRILCWTWAASSTVRVSPSAIFTTWPPSEWRGVAQQARAARTKIRTSARRFMAGIVAPALSSRLTSRPKQVAFLKWVPLQSPQLVCQAQSSTCGPIAVAPRRTARARKTSTGGRRGNRGRNAIRLCELCASCSNSRFDLRRGQIMLGKSVNLCRNLRLSFRFDSADGKAL